MYLAYVGTDRRTDDGQKGITKAHPELSHPEHSSGELKSGYMKLETEFSPLWPYGDSFLISRAHNSEVSGMI